MSILNRIKNAAISMFYTEITPIIKAQSWALACAAGEVLGYAVPAEAPVVVLKEKTNQGLEWLTHTAQFEPDSGEVKVNTKFLYRGRNLSVALLAHEYLHYIQCHSGMDLMAVVRSNKTVFDYAGSRHELEAYALSMVVSKMKNITDVAAFKAAYAKAIGNNFRSVRKFQLSNLSINIGNVVMKKSTHRADLIAAASAHAWGKVAINVAMVALEIRAAKRNYVENGR